MAPRAAYYLSTPIYYVNDSPHIGHAYTSLACDVLARFMRLDGRDVLFLTGTDEHGQKVQKSAAAAGMEPQDFVDQVSQRFRDLGEIMGLSNDDFIRTTEDRHTRSCQELWRRIVANGHIYIGNYSGWYSVREEAFYTEAGGHDRPRRRQGDGGGRLAGRMGGGAELFLPPLGLAGAAARILREQPASGRAGEPAQRGHQLRLRRAERPLRIAREPEMGHPRARRSRPHDVRVAGRADQLHQRRRVPRYGERTLPHVLAGPISTWWGRTFCAFTRSTGPPS